MITLHREGDELRAVADDGRGGFFAIELTHETLRCAQVLMDAREARLPDWQKEKEALQALASKKAKEALKATAAKEAKEKEAVQIQNDLTALLLTYGNALFGEGTDTPLPEVSDA